MKKPWPLPLRQRSLVAFDLQVKAPRCQVDP